MRENIKWFAIIALGTIFLMVSYLILSPRLDMKNELDDLRVELKSVTNPLDTYYDFMNQSDSLFALNKHQDALQTLDKGIDSLPDYSSMFSLEKGRVLFEMGNYESALRELDLSIEASKYGNVRAFEWKAYAYLNLGQLDSAKHYAGLMLKGNTSFADSYERIIHFADSLSNQNE
ncbi:tetratricopeptide repeat protein [Roseivirga pacifica]|uniref:tetratricopeptide repeat protein n=1 Tax=Roseivirga pacifica TaxID=1267423 RepID=UPI003BAF95FC